jgi:F-box and leucine-rich repeat protein 2/20
MSPDPLSTGAERSSLPEQKGKGRRSTPVEIPSSGTEDALHDLFSISLDSDNPPHSSHPGPSSPPANRNDLTATSKQLTSRNDLDGILYDTDLPYLDKGKARDSPPILPPLTFPPITFDICPSPSLISDHGPSSYGSLRPHNVDHESLPNTPPVTTADGVASTLPPSSPRRRSFSTPLLRHPERPIPTSVRTRMLNIGSSRGPHGRSHKHSSSDPRQARSMPSSPGVGVQVPIDLDAIDAGSCLAPWKRDFRSRLRDRSRAGSYSCLVPDRFSRGSIAVLPDSYPAYFAAQPAAEDHTRRANPRSYSDPFPLHHPFDVVSTDATDAFVPIPIINPPNLFDRMLPWELRLRTFGFLVEIHEDDHGRRVRQGRWTATKASKHKWVGRDQGIRELVRLTRVSMRSIPL